MGSDQLDLFRLRGCRTVFVAAQVGHTRLLRFIQVVVVVFLPGRLVAGVEQSVARSQVSLEEGRERLLRLFWHIGVLVDASAGLVDLLVDEVALALATVTGETLALGCYVFEVVQVLQEVLHESLL